MSSRSFKAFHDSSSLLSHIRTGQYSFFISHGMLGASNRKSATKNQYIATAVPSSISRPLFTSDFTSKRRGLSRGTSLQTDWPPPNCALYWTLCAIAGAGLASPADPAATTAVAQCLRMRASPSSGCIGDKLLT